MLYHVFFIIYVALIFSKCYAILSRVGSSLPRNEFDSNSGLYLQEDHRLLGSQSKVSKKHTPRKVAVLFSLFAAPGNEVLQLVSLLAVALVSTRVSFGPWIETPRPSGAPGSHCQHWLCGGALPVPSHRTARASVAWCFAVRWRSKGPRSGEGQFRRCAEIRPLILYLGFAQASAIPGFALDLS